MKRAILGSVVAAWIAAAPSAHAAEGDGSVAGPLGAFHPEVAARMTFGTPLGSPYNGPPGPLTGLGYGVRGGLSYYGVYGGLAYTDFLTEGDCIDGSVESCGTTHGRSFGFEGGYGRTFLRILTIRGQLGIGNYWTISDGTTTTCAGVDGPCTLVSSHGSSNTLYLQPEALVEVSLGPVLVGVDASLSYMPNVSSSAETPSWAFAAFMFGAQAGVRL